MKILLNERETDVPGPTTTLRDLVERFRPGADVLVVNGFPARLTTRVEAGDHVVLFTRGEVPSDDELSALLSARHTPGIAQRLAVSRVGIAGLGGLGSTIAVALARVGVGTLVLADHDVVEPTNINRQQYFLDQLGQPKVEALAATLRRIRPSIGLCLHQVQVTEENAQSIFEGCDVVAEAFDVAATKVMLIETLKGMPIVAGSGMAGYGPANEIRTQNLGDLYVCGDETSEARPGQGLMAPRVGVAAHHQANQILRLLLGEED